MRVMSSNRDRKHVDEITCNKPEHSSKHDGFTHGFCFITFFVGQSVVSVLSQFDSVQTLYRGKLSPDGRSQDTAALLTKPW